MTLSKIVAVVAAAVGITASASAQQTYSIGTNPQGSLFYGSGTAVAKVLNEKAGMLARVQAGGGTSTIMPQLDAGKVDFSFNNALEARFAYTGTGTFEGRPNKNLRIVTMVFPLRVSMAVPADSPIKTLADAKGKRIPSEFASQNIMASIQDALLANWGLKQADLQGIPVSDYIKGGDLMTQGKVDLSMVAPGTGASKKQHAELKSDGGLRFLAMRTDAESMKRMHAVFPETFTLEVKPDPNFPGILAPTHVMAYPAFLTVGAHVPDEVVAKVVKTLHANDAALGAAFAPLKEFEAKGMWRKHGTPYHPGALKAYKELGVIVSGS